MAARASPPRAGAGGGGSRRTIIRFSLLVEDSPMTCEAVRAIARQGNAVGGAIRFLVCLGGLSSVRTMTDPIYQDLLVATRIAMRPARRGGRLPEGAIVFRALLTHGSLVLSAIERCAGLGDLEPRIDPGPLAVRAHFCLLAGARLYLYTAGLNLAAVYGGPEGGLLVPSAEPPPFSQPSAAPALPHVDKDAIQGISGVKRRRTREVEGGP